MYNKNWDVCEFLLTSNEINTNPKIDRNFIKQVINEREHRFNELILKQYPEIIEEEHFKNYKLAKHLNNILDVKGPKLKKLKI